MDTANNSVILELKDLTKIYKNDIFKKPQVALDHVSVQFKRGICHGLLGHNGAGKTTAIKSIFQLITPNAGSIFFKNKLLRKKDLLKLGYMPEINKNLKNITVNEALAFQLQVLRPDLNATAKKNRITALLKETGLEPHRHKLAGKLSKGLGRRLSWGLATIHDPELIILDEPFSGLDPWGRIQMENWILQKKNLGISIILCTHEIWAIESICDEICILKKGALVFPKSEAQNPTGDGKVEGLFHLKLSGIPEAELYRNINELKMPLWRRLTMQGFTAHLVFEDYNHAITWLNWAQEGHHIVLTFEQKNDIRDADLMEYFKVEA